MTTERCHFDNIIVTAPNETIAISYQYQLHSYKSQLSQFFQKSNIFCCSDPNGKRIGSGGGSLHALNEFRKAFPHVSLSTTKTLLIHSGGDSRRAPFYSIIGKAFMSLNAAIVENSGEEQSELVATPLLILIKEIDRFFTHLLGNSLVITCSDVLLRLGKGPERFPTDDLTIITLPAPSTTAVNHGVIFNQDILRRLSKPESNTAQDPIEDSVDLYLQKPTLDFLQRNHYVYSTTDSTTTFRVENALIDTGILLFTGSVFQSLLDLIESFHGLFLSTYLRFELYSELLLAFSVKLHPSTEMGFLDYGKKFSSSISHQPRESYSNYERALEVLWAKFSLFTMKLICIPQGTFAHLGTSKELLELMVNPGVHGLYYSGARLIKSTFFDESSTDSSSKSYGILSFGNTNTPMSHANNGDPSSIYLYEYSLLSSSVSGGSGSLSSDGSSNRMGILSHVYGRISSLLLPMNSFPGKMIQQIPLRLQDDLPGTGQLSRFVLVVLSLQDNVKLPFLDTKATVCGISWQSFLTKCSLSKNDLWSMELVDDEERTLWNARLFPVISLSAPEIGTFVERSFTSLHQINDLDESFRSELLQWKESRRLSLAEILSLGDYDGMLSWQTLLNTVHQLELFREEDQPTEKPHLFATVDFLGDQWREFYLTVRQIQNGTVINGPESIAIVLLFYLCFSSFYCFDEYYQYSQETKNVAEGNETDLISSIFLEMTRFLFPEKNAESQRRQLLTAVQIFFKKFLSSSASADSSENHYLLFHFLKNLVISGKSWKSLVITLLPLGKSLPSNQQPRFILLLSTLLLSKRVSFPSSWTKEKILEIQRAAKEVCSRVESFEEKLQFLFTALFDPMVSALRNDDHEEDGGSLDLSVVLEEQSQFLIQNHLYLSIVENLFSSSSSTSSLDQENHNLPAFWLQIPLDISKSFRRIVKATSPVRIDLAGGWSDTPPICYDKGGQVLNVAVRVNERNPMRCVSRFFSLVDGEEPHILLKCYKRDGNEDDEDATNSTSNNNDNDSGGSLSIYGIEKIFSWEQLFEVHYSSSSCALLKACLIALGLNEQVQSACGDNLSGYLRNVLGSNIEIACISDLPAGSGLGGSSILAATILASIAELFRISLKNEVLMDYVGYVEQILTTGGGWQDQIGGCFGGFKWSRSTDALPLTLSIRSFLFSQEHFLDIFQQRAFLIYTGKQRLAKNTLINALRKYSITCHSNRRIQSEDSERERESSTVDRLISNAIAGGALVEALQSATQKGFTATEIHDFLDSLGAVVNNYWRLKMEMAKGSNPPRIASILRGLRPMSVGLELTGAGGGGFIFVLLRREVSKVQLQDFIDTHNRQQSVEKLELAQVSLDNRGLRLEELSLAVDETASTLDLKEFLEE